MIVYKKLMSGLENKIPDKRERSNYILEKMIYMIEINPKNVKIAKKIFGSKSNICCANFETNLDKCLKQFGIDKFDVIIGNPPFQDEIKEEKQDNSKLRPGGKNKLYERITLISLNALNNEGFLLFVTPDNIMTGNMSKVYQEFIKYNVELINFNNVRQKYFPKIGQEMCYFLVHKVPRKNKTTTIIDLNGEKFDVILKDRPVNPVRQWTKETEKIIDKYISNEKNVSKYNRGTSKNDYSKSGKYSVIYTPKEILYTDNEKLAPDYKVKKVVLFEFKTHQPIFDETGKYGLGPHTFSIPVKNNVDGKILERFFKSNIYQSILESTTTSQYLKSSLISHLNINKILNKSSHNLTMKKPNTDHSKSSSKSSRLDKKNKTIGGNKSRKIKRFSKTRRLYK
jgi:Eco57I restriction-modification methylase